MSDATSPNDFPSDVELGLEPDPCGERFLEQAPVPASACHHAFVDFLRTLLTDALAPAGGPERGAP
jgi:hypothetical protein